ISALTIGWHAVRFSEQHRPTLGLVAAAAQTPLTLWLGVRTAVALGEALTVDHLPMRFAMGWLLQLCVIFIAVPCCCLIGALGSGTDHGQRPQSRSPVRGIQLPNV